MSVTDYSGNFGLEVEDDISDDGGDFINAPGWYVIQVTGVSDGQTNSGKAYKKFQGTVKASTVPGAEGNMFSEDVYEPNGANKDGGRFAFKRFLRLARALDLMNCHTQRPCKEMKPGDKFAVDWNTSVGKAMVVRIKGREWVSGDKSGISYDIDGLKVYHPSDQEVAEAFGSPISQVPVPPARPQGAENLIAADMPVVQPGAAAQGSVSQPANNPSGGFSIDDII